MLEWWSYENINCVNQFAGDQAAFANLAKFGDNLHFWKQLAVIRVPEVGQCGNRGNWATHYNCLGGRKQRALASRRPASGPDPTKPAASSCRPAKSGPRGPIIRRAARSP